MPIKPDSIRNYKFHLRSEGYDKALVDSFLLRLAADYQFTLEAAALARRDFHSRERRVDNVIQTAKESAEVLIREAVQDAWVVREQASEKALEMLTEASDHAAAIFDAAREEAARIIAEAEERARALTDVVAQIRGRAPQEVTEMQARAQDAAKATTDKAYDRAATALWDAVRVSLELEDKAENYLEERMNFAAQLEARLIAQERQLVLRIDDASQTLERLLSECRRVQARAATAQINSNGTSTEAFHQGAPQHGRRT
jgi:DivIVA domain-containing protein